MLSFVFSHFEQPPPYICLQICLFCRFLAATLRGLDLARWGAIVRLMS